MIITRPARTQGLPSVVVYGPPGCGKTRHAEALRVHFGLTNVHDDWVSGTDFPRTDTLVLTQESLDPSIRRAMHYEDALARLHDEPAGYPF